MGLDLSVDSGYDLWKAAQEAIPWRGQITYLQSRNEYPAISLLMQRAQEQEGGTQIVHPIVIDEEDNAKMTTPYTPNTFNVKDIMAEIAVPWRLTHVNYTISLDEMLRCAGMPKVVDLLKVKREAALMSVAELMEGEFWGTLASSADNTSLYGMKYHFPAITGAQVTAHGTAGTNTGTHQGADPVYDDASTAATWCGLDTSATAYSRVRSYNDTWDNSTGDITETSVDKILRMQMKLKFMPPKNAKDLESGTFDKFQQFTNYTVFSSIDRKARENNDSLGADLGRFSGQTVIRGIPVSYIEELDSDTTNPFLGLNFAYVIPYFLKGDNFRETAIRPSAELHRLIRTAVDATLNIVVKDRRRAGGRISYVAAA